MQTPSSRRVWFLPALVAVAILAVGAVVSPDFLAQLLGDDQPTSSLARGAGDASSDRPGDGSGGPEAGSTATAREHALARDNARRTAQRARSLAKAGPVGADDAHAEAYGVDSPEEVAMAEANRAALIQANLDRLESAAEVAELEGNAARAELLRRRATLIAERAAAE